MVEEKTQKAEAAPAEAAPLNTERAEGSVAPDVWELFHSSYMPPDIRKGYTQKPNGGEVISCPVGAPTGRPVTIYVQITPMNPVTTGDTVTVSPTFTYVDSAGTHTDNPLPVHVLQYPPPGPTPSPNYCVYPISVGSNWTSLTLTGYVEPKYIDGTSGLYTLNEKIF